MINKNGLYEIEIKSLSSDGNGVGHIDGMAVFVPLCAVGDRLRVKIVKLQKSYAFGIIDEVLVPSPERIPIDCVHFSKCGGCAFRQISYEAELSAKRGFVRDALLRLGGVDIAVNDVIPSPLVDRYRNKVQFPVAEINGRLTVGLYSSRSHRVVPVCDCLLQPTRLNEIAVACCESLDALGLTAYDEQTRKGLLRHILIRQSEKDGSVMVCLVINGNSLPRKEEFITITDRFSEIKTIILNINKGQTNVILGQECKTLFGGGYLNDELCSVPVRLSPLSFFQVNSKGAAELYNKIREVADVGNDETLLDLYCGTGTIGLSLAGDCKKLIGVEVVSQAIADAKQNAAAMGLSNCEFICADAKDAADAINTRSEKIDLAITDPPRKGCGDEVLSYLVKMNPKRIVMVSCNPSTLARDLKYLFDHRYTANEAYPVDMFPRTPHVECVVLMSRIKD